MVELRGALAALALLALSSAARADEPKLPLVPYRDAKAGQWAWFTGSRLRGGADKPDETR